MRIRGSASRTSGAQMVSPISIESMPAMTARSPATAHSSSMRCSAARPQQLGHAKGLRLTGFEETGHHRPALEATPFHTADHEPAHELVVVEGHGLELQRPVDIDLRRRRVLDDGFQQRPQIRARLLRIQRCGSPLGRRVHDGEVELIVGSARGDQEIEDLVHDRVGALLRAIDLVDDEQRPQTVGQRLPDARIGSGASRPRRRPPAAAPRPPCRGRAPPLRRSPRGRACRRGGCARPRNRWRSPWRGS